MSGLTSLVSELKAKGVMGHDLFTSLAEYQVSLKRENCKNRCVRCWHDQQLRCICQLIPTISMSTLKLPNVKCLILMHHKEYLSAGNTAKFLLAILPKESVELFIFGLEDDWERFQNELSIDPTHTLTLWPGVNAVTINHFLKSISNKKNEMGDEQQERMHIPFSCFNSETKISSNNHNSVKDSGGNAVTSTSSTFTSTTRTTTTKTIRVVVLDGVYNHASNMYKTMRKRLPSSINPCTVALHPSTPSLFHRAEKKYAKDSKHSKHSKIRISTVEAYALLLSELGENDNVVNALIQSVVINNDALKHSLLVRPKGGQPKSKTSGAFNRKLRKKK